MIAHVAAAGEERGRVVVWLPTAGRASSPAIEAAMMLARAFGSEVESLFVEDKQLFDLTKIGPAGLLPGYQSDMPGFKDILGDADIWAVLSYIESTWAPEIRVRQQRMNAGRQ